MSLWLINATAIIGSGNGSSPIQGHMSAHMNAYMCISVYIYIYAYTLNYQQSISLSRTNYRFSEEVNSIWIHSWSPNHDVHVYSLMFFVTHCMPDFLHRNVCYWLLPLLFPVPVNKQSPAEPYVYNEFQSKCCLFLLWQWMSAPFVTGMSYHMPSKQNAAYASVIIIWNA